MGPDKSPTRLRAGHKCDTKASCGNTARQGPARLSIVGQEPSRTQPKGFHPTLSAASPGRKAGRAGSKGILGRRGELRELWAAGGSREPGRAAGSRAPPSRSAKRGAGRKAEDSGPGGSGPGKSGREKRAGESREPPGASRDGTSTAPGAAPRPQARHALQRTLRSAVRRCYPPRGPAGQGRPARGPGVCRVFAGRRLCGMQPRRLPAPVLPSASRRQCCPAPLGDKVRQAGETAPRSLRHGERRRDGG
jgi:hypothetical protein